MENKKHPVSHLRQILHCDMNNFYASVECMLDPALRDKAVAVCGSAEERHGIVLAKNYKAKAFGVTTGEAIWQAQRKCRDLTIVSPHYEQYMKFSRLAREIYGRYTDQIEPYGMDECWLDVSGSGCMGTPLEIAEQLRQTIKFELGLTISIGVSFNKVFAKLGSDLKKPDAITVIPQESFREQIWGLQASEMIGVGKATERILSNYGIHTIGDLADAPETLLQARLGKNGLALKRYANGLDTSPVKRMDYQMPVKSIGHGTTCIQDLENSAEVWVVMLELVQDIGSKLRKCQKKASGVAIGIRDCDLHTKEWQCKLDYPTQSPSIVAQRAYALFEKGYRWERPVRSVTVRVIDLLDDGCPVQLNAFYDPRRTAKKEKLDEVIEDLRRRFGKNAIRNGILYQHIKVAAERPQELITMPGTYS